MTDPVVRSDDFDRRLAGSRMVQALVAMGKTNRRIIHGLLFSVALDIGLSIALIFVAVGAQSTADKAASVQTQTRLQCQAGNEARAAQLQLWTYVLSLSSNTRTRLQKEQAVQFRSYIKKVFAPRDCDNLKKATAVSAPPSVAPQTVSTPAPTMVTVKPTVVVVEPSRESSSPSPSHSASPSRSASPTPSPSPSRTCIINRICLEVTRSDVVASRAGSRVPFAGAHRSERGSARRGRRRCREGGGTMNQGHLSARQITVARDRAVQAALLALHNAPAIHYTLGPLRWEGIKQHKLSYKGEFPNFADCSAFYTWCVWNALYVGFRVVDIVNGASWEGGWTGTMSQHGEVIGHLRDAVLGDAVLYGSGYPYEHTAIVVGSQNGHPLVVSHGSEAGPFLLRADYRSDIGAIRRYIHD